MTKKYFRGLTGTVIILLSILACRPVIAIGWEEFLFLCVVIAILLGPLLYRFVRRIEDFRRDKRNDK